MLIKCKYESILLFALALFAAGAAYAQAYKWIDEDGIVHYSDRPEPGAERVDLGQSRAPRPGPCARRSTVVKPDAARSAAAEQSKPFRYESLERRVARFRRNTMEHRGRTERIAGADPGAAAGAPGAGVFRRQCRGPVAGTSFQLTGSLPRRAQPAGGDPGRDRNADDSQRSEPVLRAANHGILGATATRRPG